MKRFPVRRMFILTLTTLTIWALQIPALSETQGTPGSATGTGDQLFSAWQRQSLYITVRDGTRLAADINTLVSPIVITAAPFIRYWPHYSTTARPARSCGGWWR